MNEEKNILGHKWALGTTRTLTMIFFAYFPYLGGNPELQLYFSSFSAQYMSRDLKISLISFLSQKTKRAPIFLKFLGVEMQ